MEIKNTGQTETTHGIQSGLLNLKYMKIYSVEIQIPFASFFTITLVILGVSIFIEGIHKIMNIVYG